MEMVSKVFGKSGAMIWKKANGIDNSPVVAYRERKSISTERTFDKDTTDITKLTGIMSSMAENLAFQLRRGGKLTACVSVKIRYSDFNTHTLQKRIPYAAADHVLIPLIMELFKKIYNRRLLVRLIGVKYSHLVGGAHQINLFEDSSKMMDLYQAMDEMRDKYGDRAVVRAVGMGTKSISRFNPFDGEPPPLLPNRRR